MADKKVKMWITKYALTNGVYRVKGTLTSMGDINVERGYMNDYFRIGTEAFEDQGDAHKKAEEMRITRIKSLRKQIAKLEGLTWNPKGG